MRLPELFTAHPPTVELADYRRTPRGMPPLTATELALLALVGDQTHGRLIEGQAALLLKYKGSDAAVTSLNEQDGGERWNVVQLQGARSRKSYRVASAFAVTQCFAEQLRAYMLHPEADVRQVLMPHPHSVTNIDGADDMEAAIRKYEIYAGLLGMRFSRELGMFVVDVRDAMSKVLGSE